MALTLPRVFAALLAIVILTGCAGPRLLMPTPVVYLAPSGQPVFEQTTVEELRPEVDLLFITDRGPPLDPDFPLPYGQQRSTSIAFGSAKVRILPELSGKDLALQSRLQTRTEELNLEMGPIKELGRFPRQPYELSLSPEGKLYRDRSVMQAHQDAKNKLIAEVQRRLAASPNKEIMLYVHGFNETFATAAFTAAELCHFMGREPVCVFFTWPASSTGNFLISYTATTESAEYAVNHLKQTIRILARTPGVERVQLLAHSRGTAVLLSAARELIIEAVAAGIEPIDEYQIDNVVLFSPDIDMEIAGQQLTTIASDPDMVTAWTEARLPRALHGRLTIYASPDDRALLVSRILFRSRGRLGSLRPEDVSPEAQAYFARNDVLDLIVFKGKRTDIFGHLYFTGNPRVSSDLIQMLRYDKKIGEPGRELIKSGPITWVFPTESVAASQ